MDEEKKEERRKKLIAKGIIAAGVGLAATGLAGCGNNEKQQVEDETTQYKVEDTTKGIEVNTEESTEIQEETEEKDIFDKIVEEYKEKYPEKEISKEDLGMIKSSHMQYLIERTNEKGETEYVINYKEEFQLNENETFKTEGIGEIYTIVNKKTGETVFSIGIINGSPEELKAERIKSPNNIDEYVSNGEEIDLGIEQEESEYERQIIKGDILYEAIEKFDEIIHPEKYEDENER